MKLTLCDVENPQDALYGTVVITLLDQSGRPGAQMDCYHNGGKNLMSCLYPGGARLSAVDARVSYIHFVPWFDLHHHKDKLMTFHIDGVLNGKRVSLTKFIQFYHLDTKETDYPRSTRQLNYVRGSYEMSISQIHFPLKIVESSDITQLVRMNHVTSKQSFLLTMNEKTRKQESRRSKIKKKKLNLLPA
jgi:hypothetical protein